MKVPSGRIFDNLDVELMKATAKFGLVRWYDEPRPLAGGGTSHVYVEGREDTTENPTLLRLISEKVLTVTTRMMDRDGDMRRPRFIGIPHVTYGWTPAFTMVDELTDITRRRTCHLVMRVTPKSHGGRANQWVAGSPNPKLYRDILFDNVVTKAGSAEDAFKHLEADGWGINDLDVMVFIDREQGGFYHLERMGFRSEHACYRITDMFYAFEQLGLWTPKQVERATREIRGQQTAV